MPGAEPGLGVGVLSSTSCEPGDRAPEAAARSRIATTGLLKSRSCYATLMGGPNG
jgi:hypothetical protein